MARTHTRQFTGPWPQAHARIQLYLLEMLAGGADPAVLRIRLAKPLLSPEDIRRDVAPLRDVLVRRLGSGRACVELIDDAHHHEVRLECAAASPVKDC